MMLFAYFIIILFSLSAVMGAPVSRARRCVNKSYSASDVVNPTSTTATAKPTVSGTSTEKPTSTHSSISSKPTSSSTSESSIPAGWPFTTSVDSSKSSFGVTGKFEQSYLSTVEGEPTLVGDYPAGSYAGVSDIGGFIFEASGGDDVDIDSAKEAVLNYEVKFPENFDFVLAGKLPGFYGGDSLDIAKTCAGGNHDDRCWSARLMWREDGQGELYAYLPTANQKLAVCKGKCDVHYGASIGTGSWSFKPGEWTQVTERVKLNDLNEMNGEIEILINGESKVSVNGLMLRTSESGAIRGGMIHSFFGGSSSPSYATPSAQQSFFRNFSFQVTEKL